MAIDATQTCGKLDAGFLLTNLSGKLSYVFALPSAEVIFWAVNEIFKLIFVCVSSDAR